MKISLSYKPVETPWGGGNQFAALFVGYFRQAGHTVVHTLDKDTDIALFLDPRHGDNKTFTHREVIKAKRRLNPEMKVIHRVNDTDVARGTHFLDRLLKKANRCADETIFISEWLKDYFEHRWGGFTNTAHVIRNGADEQVFHPGGQIPWSGTGPLKIVSHHWSDNLNKGFAVYQWMDELLADPWMRARFEFTYIGRFPEGINFCHTKLIPPLYGERLAQALREHHVYLTAARNEACGMHHVEACLCGLPPMFSFDGGGVVECCKPYGIEFNLKTFPAVLFQMRERYHELRHRISSYAQTSANMLDEYRTIIEALTSAK